MHCFIKSHCDWVSALFQSKHLLKTRVSEGKIINAASSDLVVLDFGHIFVVHLMFEPFVAIVHLALMI